MWWIKLRVSNFNPPLTITSMSLYRRLVPPLPITYRKLKIVFLKIFRRWKLGRLFLVDKGYTYNEIRFRIRKSRPAFSQQEISCKHVTNSKFFPSSKSCRFFLVDPQSYLESLQNDFRLLEKIVKNEFVNFFLWNSLK